MEHDMLTTAVAALRTAVPEHEELLTAITVAAEARTEQAARAMTEATEAHEREAALGSALVEAVTAYRDRILAADPTLPADLVTGSSIGEIDATAERARATVARVREALLQEAARQVPAGAPGRTPPDLTSLSPREKIAFGVDRKT